MTSMIDAAYAILHKRGVPQHYKDIIKQAIAQKLIVSGGLTPGASLISAIARENAARINQGELPRFELLGSGVYGLVEWRPIGITGQIQQINKTTRENLKKRIAAMSPKAFEEMIGELLVAIGFDESTVVVQGRSGDGGIDVVGAMNIDGLTQIKAAAQVKRVKQTIAAEKITALRGSLLPNQRGIFVTTSKFSGQAVQEAQAVGKSPISLIDGEQLIDLLFKYKIGVVSKEHPIFEIDPDYWPELPAAEVVLMPAPNGANGALNRLAVEYPLTIFAQYEDQQITARLLSSGEVVYDSDTYPSLSAAGKAVTGWKSCNGWRFWQFTDVDSGLSYTLEVLRQPSDQGES